MILLMVYSNNDELLRKQKYTTFYTWYVIYKLYTLYDFDYSLRRRLKAQHDVITSQSTRLAYYQANVEKDVPVQDHSTGQSE